MLTETPEDLPQLVVGVTFYVEAAQPHRAAPVLQFLVHAGQEGRGLGQREILLPEAEQLCVPHVPNCVRDLLLVGLVEPDDPVAGTIELVTMPNRRSGDHLGQSPDLPSVG